MEDVAELAEAAVPIVDRGGRHARQPHRKRVPHAQGCIKQHRKGHPQYHFRIHRRVCPEPAGRGLHRQSQKSVCQQHLSPVHQDPIAPRRDDPLVQLQSDGVGGEHLLPAAQDRHRLHGAPNGQTQRQLPADIQLC